MRFFFQNVLIQTHKAFLTQNTAYLRSSSSTIYQRQFSAFSEMFQVANTIAEQGLTGYARSNLQDKLDSRKEKQANDMYAFFKSKILEEEGKFTYGAYYRYFKALCDYLGIDGLRQRITRQQTDPENLRMKSHLRVLEAMLPSELLSDDPSIFTIESKKLIAEAANVKLHVVNQVLLNHDALKTERTWYMRRLILGRELPKTWTDRVYEAEFDRPITKQLPYGERVRTLEMRESLRKVNRWHSNKQSKAKTWPWFRRPTKGVDRWRRGPYTKHLTVFPPYQLGPPNNRIVKMKRKRVRLDKMT